MQYPARDKCRYGGAEHGQCQNCRHIGQELLFPHRKARIEDNGEQTIEKEVVVETVLIGSSREPNTIMASPSASPSASPRLIQRPMRCAHVPARTRGTATQASLTKSYSVHGRERDPHSSHTVIGRFRRSFAWQFAMKVDSLQDLSSDKQNLSRKSQQSRETESILLSHGSGRSSLRKLGYQRRVGAPAHHAQRNFSFAACIQLCFTRCDRGLSTPYVYQGITLVDVAER